MNIKYILLIILLITTINREVSYSDEYSCGILCLKEICKYYNQYDALKKINNNSEYKDINAMSIYDLYSLANKLNINCVPMKLTFNDLCKNDEISIAYVDNNHFVIVNGCSFLNRLVYIKDPPASTIEIHKKDFLKRWDGKTLVFSKKFFKKYKNEVGNALKPLDGILYPKNWTKK